MDFDGAVNAKADVFLKAFHYSEIATASSADESGPTFVPLPDSSAYADIARARRSRKLDAKEKIAVGILRSDVPSGRSESLKLGLFVQHRKLLDHPVVMAAQRIAHGEAEVVVTGRVRRHAALNPGLCRPLRLGGSIGHQRVTAGTIGCFAVSRGSGEIGILSNNHVLANTNRGRQGDIILQPGRADCRPRFDATNHVATLESFVEIDFDPGAANLVDCAFALLNEGMEREALAAHHPVIGGNAWQIGEPEELILDKVPVKKFGRTTGYTEGTVEAISVDNLSVQMILGANSKFAIFNRQVVVSGDKATFSKPGDSGSLICTDDGRPVALLFAGTEFGGPNGRGITYANPIRTVLDALDVDIYN